MAKGTKSSRGEAKTASEETTSNVQASNPNEDKTREIIADFQKALKENEIAQAAAEMETADENLKHALSAHEIAERSFRWERGWRFEYHKIKQKISLRLGQSGVEFQGNINQSKTLRDTVKTNLNTAVQSVKDVNKKLLVVMEKANNLNNKLKETCNKEDAKRLDYTVQLKERLDELMEKINEASYESNDNFNTAVKTAGIFEYTNIQSLVNMATAIKTNIDAFKANVDENLNYFKGEAEKKKTKLDEEVVKLVEKQDDLAIATLRLEALQDVEGFANPDAERVVEKDIDEVVEEAEKNYEDLIPQQDLRPEEITEGEGVEDSDEEEEEEEA